MKKIRLHPFFTQNKIAFLSLGLIFSSWIVGNSLSGANPSIYKLTGDQEPSKAVTKTDKKAEKSEDDKVVNFTCYDNCMKNGSKNAAKCNDTCSQTKPAPAKTTAKPTAPKTPDKTTEKTTIVNFTCYDNCMKYGSKNADSCTATCTQTIPAVINPSPTTTLPADWDATLPPDLTNIDPESSCNPSDPNACDGGLACTAMARPVGANGNLLYPDKPTIYRCDIHPNANNRNCEVNAGNSGEYINVQEGFVFDDYATKCESQYDANLGYSVNTGYVFTQNICANGTIFEVERSKSYNTSLCPLETATNETNSISGNYDGSPACGLIVLGRHNDTGVTDFANSDCCKVVDVQNGVSPDGVPYKNVCSGFEATPDLIYDLFHNEVGTFGFPEFGVSEFVGGVINDIFQ